MLLVIFPTNPIEQRASFCLFFLQYGFGRQHRSMAFMFMARASVWETAARSATEMSDRIMS